MNENINLWFAKDDEGQIVIIDKANKNGKYICPLCGSEVIPKALNSDMITPHYAHTNKAECSGETMMHYWVKNELIKPNDVFEVVTDVSQQHMCREIVLEEIYDTPYGKYKPDITIVTYNDEKIFIEVNYTNKKNVDDYYSKWKHLGNTVIEFNIKGLYDKENNKINISNSFKALYYKNMIINKNDKEYISYKRSLENKISERFIDKIKEIEWFIDDLYRYNIGLSNNIEELTNSFLYLAKDNSNLPILEMLYKNSRCQETIKDILEIRDEFSDRLRAILNSEGLNISNNAKNRKIADKVKNNVLTKQINIPIKDKQMFKILEIFLKYYDYFYESILQTKKSIDLIYTSESMSFWEDEVDEVVIKLKITIDDVLRKDKYVEIMEQQFCNEEIISILRRTVEMRDYVVGNENLENMFVDLFTNYDKSVLKILLTNNEAYFANTIKFINSMSKKIKYNDYIKKIVKNIDFENFKYVNDGVTLIDINNASNKIIMDFEREYCAFEERIKNLIDYGMVHYNSGFRFFMKENNFFEKMLILLNEKNIFKNYNEYKDNNKTYIKQIIQNELMNGVIKNDEYIKDIEGESFIRSGVSHYFKIVYNDKIIKISEKYEMLYTLQHSIKNIFTAIGADVLKESASYCQYFDTLKYYIEIKINNIIYRVEIDNKNITINNIPIARINEINSCNEIIEKLKFVIDVITKDNRAYFDESIIRIYNKLVSVYRTKTKYSYNIRIDYDCSDVSISISYFDDEITSYKICKNTTFEEVIKVFSEAVREYLYGNKEE